MVERMLEGIEVKLNTDYFDNREYWNSVAEKVIYTGPIDAYGDFGETERLFRFSGTLISFETEQRNSLRCG